MGIQQNTAVTEQTKHMQQLIYIIYTQGRELAEDYKNTNLYRAFNLDLYFSPFLYFRTIKQEIALGKNTMKGERYHATFIYHPPRLMLPGHSCYHIQRFYCYVHLVRKREMSHQASVRPLPDLIEH
jgi:hypothetical protein